MKLPEKKKVKNAKLKKKSIIKPKKEKVLVVAQEFKFARLLSGNEKKTRDRVLKTLKKWLLNCFEKGYEFKEDDFIRVWKGLFYAVWMSDKPLVQEELCDSISEILDLFPVEQVHHAIVMMKAGFRVLATEWYGLDQHRMDKFLMLVRRYLRGGWRCLKRADWSNESCEKFVEMLVGQDGLFALKTPSFARNSLSLMLHITDCYLEELSKVSRGSLPLDSMAILLRPFTLHVRSDTPLSIPSRRLLTQLIRQSELGLDYESKTQAWNKMGCPPGGPEALELVEDDDDEDLEETDQDDVEDDGSGPLDPRAGRVSVLLSPLPVPGTALAEQLRGPAANHQGRRRAEICAQKFLALSSSEYPLRVSASDVPEPLPKGVSPGRAARTLVRLEKQLGDTKDELALKAMSKKHRKKLLAKSRAGLNIVDEVALESTQNGEWQVEETENTSDANKENMKMKKNRKRKARSEENTLENNKKKKISGNEVNTNGKDKKDKEVKKRKQNKEINKDGKLNNQATGDKLTKGVNKNKKNKNNVTSNTNEANKEIKINVQKHGAESENKEKNDTDSNKMNGFNKDKKNKLQRSKGKEQKSPKVIASKAKNYQKPTQAKKDSPKKKVLETPKKVKFVLKNNSMQGTVDYYKSVRQSPNIPYDGTKKPSKTNLKPSTPSPINPFFKKKFKLKMT